MLPEQFYFTGAGWLGYVLYVPFGLLAAWVVYWYALRKIPLSVLRWLITSIVSVTLLTLPLWEALAISYEAEKLCKEQGGLHVYKTVETDGFLGGWGIETAAEHGFSYVESGGGKHMSRWTMVNDEPVRENITEFKSRYQVQTGADSRKIGNKFRRSSSRVINQENGGVLGELVTIGIYPSRFDLLILHLLPVDYNGWQCGNEAPEGEGSYNQGKKKYVYNFFDVIKATLKPKKSKEGEIQ